MTAENFCSLAGGFHGIPGDGSFVRRADGENGVPVGQHG